MTTQPPKIELDTELGKLRNEIDGLTTELFQTLDTRMGVVLKVGELKHQTLKTAAEFYRVDREALMLDAMQQRAFSHLDPVKAAQLLKEIISMSLSSEAPQRVAFVQEAQSLSSLAVMDRFGHQAVYCPRSSQSDALAALHSDEAEHAVLALNSSVLANIIAEPTLYLNGRIVFALNQTTTSQTANTDFTSQYMVISRCPALLTQTLDRQLWWIKPASAIVDAQNLPERYQKLARDLQSLHPDASIEPIADAPSDRLIDLPGHTPDDDTRSILQQHFSDSCHFIGHYAAFAKRLSPKFA